MSIEEVIDFLKSKKKLYYQMDNGGRKDYVMECLDTAINSLSNMTEGDLISRVKDIIRNDTYLSEAQVIDLLRRIDELPSAEKPAEWVHTNETATRCPICGYRNYAELFPYCPNCGRRMKGEIE